MKALRCTEHGPLNGLTVEELPDPVAGPGEVVVDVHAAAVNFSDILIVEGTYQVKAPVPFTPGSEFAGTVIQVGPDVEGFTPGDAVSGSMFVGAFAERVAVPATSLTLLPPGTDLQAAAAFGVAYATAHHALTLSAELREGETLAVLGAAGGVGLAAVELGKLLGARVIAVASSREKRDVCTARGADVALPYENLKQNLREAGGVDVVLDPVGGDHAEQALRSLNWRGRFVTVGFAAGDIPRIPLNLVMLKGISIRGFEFRGWGTNEPEAMHQSQAELTRLFQTGVLKPHIHAAYPLDRAAEALAAVQGRTSTGKVLIVTDASQEP